MWHVYLYLTLLILCCGYAFARGGTPERLAALMVIMAVAASAVVESGRLARFYSLEVDLFLVDVALFLGALALAAFANRFWPIWMAAVEGFAVFGHLAVWITPSSIVPKVYAVATAFSAYPTLLLLALGTYRHRKRLMRLGIDPPWRNSSRL
jgi:hypothetical protein